MKIHLMQQTSPEWWEIRRAKATASDFDKIITAVKGQASSSQKKYICELLEDAAMPDAAYFSKFGIWRGSHAMQHGRDFEAEARRWYALETDLDVQQVGFCESECGLFGCSPDGVIGLETVEKIDGLPWPAFIGSVEGCLELKCPQLSTHFGYLEEGTLPNEYKAQCHAQLVVTGCKWVDFVSYHPDCKDGLRVRVEPNEFTAKVAAELKAFLVAYTDVAKRRAVALTRRPRVAALAEGEVAETF